MQLQQSRHFGLMSVSLLVGCLITVIPLPQDWGWYRPELLVLLVIYWVMAMPQQVGIGMAFAVGLLYDIIEFGTLGLHALAMVAVAYVCLLSYQRIRNYALWQQSAWVFILVGIHQIFWNWGHSLAGASAPSFIFLASAFISALLWIPMSVMLQILQRHF